jgi:hypothetical protein
VDLPGTRSWATRQQDTSAKANHDQRRTFIGSTSHNGIDGTARAIHYTLIRRPLNMAKSEELVGPRSHRPHAIISEPGQVNASSGTAGPAAGRDHTIGVKDLDDS